MAAVAKLAEKESFTLGPLGIFNPPEIHVECPVFTGTLGILFVCIRDRKIDLLDVPLAPICEAYFRYLIDNAESDLDGAGVALAALAFLVEKKAWMLIPTNEEEEPEGEDILDFVDPYVQEFAPAISDLLDRQSERDLLFFRHPDAKAQGYELPFDTTEVTSLDLAKAFEKLLAKAKPDPVEQISRPRRNLSEQMVIVMKALPDDFQTLENIVTGEFTRSEVVWWFLALLELIRLGQASVKIEDGEVQFARGHAS